MIKVSYLYYITNNIKVWVTFLTYKQNDKFTTIRRKKRRITK